MIHLNEAGLQLTELTLRERLRLLWRVAKYVVKPLTYYGVRNEIDQFGRIVVSGWIKKPGDAEYKYHYVAYDGETAPSAFKDGKLIERFNNQETKLIGRTYNGKNQVSDRSR